jgi:hypothetical protein
MRVQVLPKQPAVSGRHRRGSGRAGREIHMAKIHKELDVLRKCVPALSIM